MAVPGNTYQRGRICTIDLLILTSLDQLLLILKLWFILFYWTNYLNEVVKCTEPSPSVRDRWLTSLLCSTFKIFQDIRGQVFDDLNRRNSKQNATHFISQNFKSILICFRQSISKIYQQSYLLKISTVFRRSVSSGWRLATEVTNFNVNYFE